MSRLAVLLLNLDGSTTRLAAAASGLGAAGLAFTRISAFDGRRLPVGELPLYDGHRALRETGRALIGGEVGCFLSHLAAARAFLARDCRYGLILEDDVVVPPHAGAALEHLLDALEAGAAAGPWALANLGRAAHRLYTPLGSVGFGHVLQRAHYFPVTTTAILWTRSGAEAFVQGVDRITMPVDEWFRVTASQADNGLALCPQLFSAASGASDIDAGDQRKSLSKGWTQVRVHHQRLWTSKVRAWRHKAAFKPQPGFQTIASQSCGPARERPPVSVSSPSRSDGLRVDGDGLS